MDCPASDSPACARASSRLSRGIGLDDGRPALSDTKSPSPPLSSIRCAMHAAELRKKRSANVSWSVASLLPMECDTNWSTLSVSSPDETVSTRAHASAASAEAAASALGASSSAALRFLRLGALSTSASVAALAVATTSRARSRLSAVAARRLDRGQQHEDEHRAPLDERVGLLGVLLLLLAVAQRVPPVQADAAAQERHRRLLAHLLAVGDRVAQPAQRAPHREVRQQRQALRRRLGAQPVDQLRHRALLAVGALLGRAL